MASERQIGFNSSLYSREALEAAMLAYGDFAQIELQEDKADLLVLFRDPDPDFGEDLFDAFCNHALFESIVRKRGTSGALP